MCLTHAIKFTPDNDLTVYKVLMVSRFENESELEAYHSPYFPKTKWTAGKRESLNVNVPEIRYSFFEQKGTVVEGNAFHSFHTYDKAKEEALYFISVDKTMKEDGTYVVCECTIPKDSRFVYRGCYDNGISYASSDLVLNRICGYFSTL